MTSVTVSARSLSSLAADALVLLAAPDGEAASLLPLDGLPDEAREFIDESLAAFGATGGLESLTCLVKVPGILATRVVVAGLGDSDDDLGARMRRAVGSAVRSVGGARSFVVAAATDAPGQLGAAAEGALLGAYRYAGQRGTSTAPTAVSKVTIWTAKARDKDVKAAVTRAQVLAGAVAWARDLVNTSPNVLYPQTFAEQVVARAKGTAIKVKVLDTAALKRGGYGGILGVGLGSSHEPRLVSVSYVPAKPVARIALVGKGITFDSGGLDIKPADGMYSMKSDMAGAAATVATVFAAAELGLPVAVTGWLALAENMPSGTAQRASDIVTTRSGKTVEITNTDAEGRMVLCDAITAAGQADGKLDALIDIATLTGHQVIALGTEIAAVMANDEVLRARLVELGDESGEPLWPMPLPETLRPQLSSDCADLVHKGARPGGMLFAGMFLQEFVPQRDGEPIPWAHLDIAGPGFNDGSPRGWLGKGGTGFGVATMLRYVEDCAS